MQKTKLDINNRYLFDKKVMESVKDDGLVYLPTEEKIEKDRRKFREFFDKYPELDYGLAGIREINDILAKSVYPSKRAEWHSITANLSQKIRRNGFKSLYKDVLSESIGVLDYDRFALSLLDYMLTGEKNPLFDSLKSVTEFKKDTIRYLDSLGKENLLLFSFYINYKRENISAVIDYNELKAGRTLKGKGLGYSNNSIEYASEMLYPYDSISFHDYYMAGVQLEDALRTGLVGIDDPDKSYVMSSSIFESYLKDKEFTTYVDEEKLAAIVLMRMSEVMRHTNAIESEKDLKQLSLDTFEFIGTLEKSQNKDKTIQMLSSNMDKNEETELIECTIGEALQEFKEAFTDYIYRASCRDRNIPFFVLRDPLLSLDDESAIMLAYEAADPEMFLFLAFDKKGIHPAVLKAVFDHNDDLDVNVIMPKLLLTKKRDVRDLIKFGLITTDNIANMYMRGIIHENDIARLMKDVDIEDKGKLEPNPSKLAMLYKCLYGDNIVKMFKNKEKYTDDDIISLLDQNPTLARTVKNREQRTLLKKELKLQSFLAREYDMFNNEEYVQEFLDSLGEELQLSSHVIVDLYKKGVITKEFGMSIDNDLSRFIKAKETGKYNKSVASSEILEKEDRVRNLYSHGRINPGDIIRLYSLGMISRKMYDELANDTFKGQVSKKVLSDMIEAIKAQGAKKEAYDAIERYVTEARRWQADPDFFKEYDSKILVSKRIDKQKLITLGQKGLLSKEALEQILNRGDVSVITKLLEGENHLSLDTARYLFQDIVVEGEKTSHAKRDLLEKVFKSGHFSNDEMFSILLATYRGVDEANEKQLDMNNENLQYFFNNGYISIEFDDGKVDRQYKEKERVQVREGEDYTGAGYDPDSQRRFPLFERFDSLFTLDEQTVFNKKGPALVFNCKTLNKTIVETLGTIKDDVLVQDLTNHGTFIMDTEVYESQKEEFITEVNGKEIIQYNRLLDWFNQYKYDEGFDYFKHTKNWAANVRKALGVNNAPKKSGSKITARQMQEIIDR